MKNSYHNGILILRIYLSILILFHGIRKLSTGISFIQNSLTEKSLPAVLGWGVFLGEIIAPILILLGFRTRIAAVILAFNMFMAIYLTKLDIFSTLTKSGGWAVELPALYFFAALVLVFTGGGKYALSRSKFGD